MNGINLGQLLYDVALFHITTAVNRRSKITHGDIIMKKNET